VVTSPEPLFSNAPEDDYTASVVNSHRKMFGQFFTPAPVAEFMAQWIVGNPSCRTVLDPAVGLGMLFRAILKIAKPADYEFSGYDLDATILDRATPLFAHFKDVNIELRNQDYLFNDWSGKYDGIICNPPYFKYRDYKNRAASRHEFKTRLGMNLSGFTNIYTMFMLKSVVQLAPQGRAAYLVPFEFLNSDYGTTIKKHLLENKTLRYIILFNSNENIFSNALTTSCVLLFANDSQTNAVTFISAQNATDLQNLAEQLTHYPHSKLAGTTVPYSELNPDIKWRAYYQKKSDKEFKHLVPLSAYGKVVRGIATGDNDYFTFDEKKKAEFNIGDRHLVPCLTKSAHAASNFFTQKEFEVLRLKGSKVYLLNALDLTDTAVKQYIELGREKGVHQRYLTSHRTPWYQIENRPPAPFLVMVFNRSGLRFVRNEANVRNLTCFHSIYPDLFASAKLDLLMAYFLTDISKEILNDNRREYGGGLNKFEPNDLNGAKVINLELLDINTEMLIRETYAAYRASVLSARPDEGALEKLNNIFSDLIVK
jgi:adenine-specific DNA-methyltransferase